MSCRHEDSWGGRCTTCGMTMVQQVDEWGERGVRTHLLAGLPPKRMRNRWWLPYETPGRSGAVARQHSTLGSSPCPGGYGCACRRAGGER